MILSCIEILYWTFQVTILEELGQKIYVIESQEHFDVIPSGRALTDEAGLAFVEMVLIKARGIIESHGKAPKTNPIPWLSTPTEEEDENEEEEAE